MHATLSNGLRAELTRLILRLETTDARVVQERIDALRRAGLVIRRVQSVRPSLEELFMDTVTDGTGRALPAGAALRAFPMGLPA
jgi:hypothetical protein